MIIKTKFGKVQGLPGEAKRKAILMAHINHFYGWLMCDDIGEDGETIGQFGLCCDPDCNCKGEVLD